MSNGELRKKLIIGLSGATGGFLAALADLIQKNEASAILKITYTIETVFRVSFPPLFALILVIGLAVSLCYIFEANTKRGAFYIGISILSIIMTLVPYNSPPSLPTKLMGTAGEFPIKSSTWYEFFSPTLSFAQSSPETQRPGNVRIHLSPDDQKTMFEVLVTVQEFHSRKIIARSKFIYTPVSDISFYLPPGKYLVTIEVPAYWMEAGDINIEPERPQSLNIRLKSTLVPLFFQRLLF